MLRDLRFAVVVVAILSVAALLQFARPMLITGNVYDPAGQAIKGVLGASSYRSGARKRAAARGSTWFISGCLLCAEVRLRVSAPDFESETIQLSAFHDSGTGDRAKRGSTLFGMVQWLRVTLYPEIDVATSHLRTELIFAKGEPQIVGTLHPDLPDRASPAQLHDEIRRLSRGAETLAPYFALESGTDAAAAIVTAAPGETDPPGRARRNPTEVSLVLHNIDGGFVVVDPVAGLPDYNRYLETRRRLRKAPADGYESHVPIDIEHGHLDGGHFFFYCRFGNRYGKGELTALEVSPSDPTRLRGHVDIWLNESGGRELPGGH